MKVKSPEAPDDGDLLAAQLHFIGDGLLELQLLEDVKFWLSFTVELHVLFEKVFLQLLEERPERVAPPPVHVRVGFRWLDAVGLVFFPWDSDDNGGTRAQGEASREGGFDEREFVNPEPHPAYRDRFLLSLFLSELLVHSFHEVVFRRREQEVPHIPLLHGFGRKDVGEAEKLVAALRV